MHLFTKRVTIAGWILQVLLPVSLFGVPKAPPLEERVKELKLDNGLTVVVAERHNSPTFFTLISFRVGSSQELPNRSGLAHFLEHMLFKGSKTVGTTNYKAEVPLMKEMEVVSTRVRADMIRLEAWRYEMFEAYALDVRANLPPEIRESSASDEGKLWRALLENLPQDHQALPQEWQTTPWTLKDDKSDYWAIYLSIVEGRAKLSELLASQKKYIPESEPLDGIYDYKGAEFMNAFTTQDQTTYMVALPSNCLELWMYLESDRFQNPVFREFYTEKEVVMEELRNGENDPESMLWQKFLGTAFDAHPYGRPIIGWEGDIRSTTKDDMEAFFWKYYTPNNCQLTIVGDVKTDEVFKLAKRYFTKWKAGEPSPAVTIIEPPQDGERRVVIERDAEPNLMIGYHTPSAPHPDIYALRVLSDILSGGRTTRFHKNIFEKKGLTAGSPSAFTGPADRYPSLFMVTATPKSPHTTEEVEAAIYEELERVKSEPVSEREIERVKNQYRKYELNRLANNRWLAFSLSSSFVDDGDWRATIRNFDRTQAVTADDIQRVANKYFTPQNRTVGILVKKETTQANAAPTEGADR